MQVPLLPDGTVPVAQVPAPGSDPAAASPDGTLNTVGLALLAYGLVQLLSRVIDRIPVGGRGAGDRRADGHGAGFSDEDRRRLAHVVEMAAEARDRQDRTGDALATQQRLIGQALDELREVRRENENLLRKLRALWRRIGRRRGDGS